ncbi:MAG: hypothetical protein IJ410_05345 [Oscillospiraceae bacterium]|nr:hypothetical protein [Oscillospiraceae bacterium]
MTFFEFCEKYSLKPLSKGEDREIEGGFAGDLHSWAMAKAEENHVWFTIMGNINTVAVASLNDVAGVVLCQNSPMNRQALEKAQEEEINLYATDKSMFEMCALLYNEMNK